MQREVELLKKRVACSCEQVIRDRCLASPRCGGSRVCGRLVTLQPRPRQRRRGRSALQKPLGALPKLCSCSNCGTLERLTLR